MAKLTITSTAVVPPTRHAASKEKVEVHAQVNCMLWFDEGFGVGLKKNESCYLAFDYDGRHSFQVEYVTAVTTVQESVSVVQASASGTSVVTESAVMTQSSRGPTGDIIVP